MRADEAPEETLLRCLRDRRYVCWSIYELGRMVGGTDAAREGVMQLRREGWPVRVNAYDLLYLRREG